MTYHELWERIPLKVVVLIVGIAIAYASLAGQVAQKADRSEVAELRELVVQQARDVRVLRIIACRQAQMDSFCRAQP